MKQCPTRNIKLSKIHKKKFSDLSIKVHTVEIQSAYKTLFGIRNDL